MEITHVLLASWFGLSLVHIANGISCFVCNSIDEPLCEKLQSNETHSEYYKNCDNTNPMEPPFCRKSVIKVLMEFEAGRPHERIIRKCGYKRDYRTDRECYKREDRDHREIHCQCFHDGCNSATSMTYVPFLIFASAMTAISRYM